MTRFASPTEAKLYIVSRLLDQSARDGVSISEFEQRLLRATATEEELEAFEDRDGGDQGDALATTVGRLAKRALQDDRKASSTMFRDAIAHSATDAGYLDAILSIEGVYKRPIATVVLSQYRRWLFLATVSLVGGLSLAFLLAFRGAALFQLMDKLLASDSARALKRLYDHYGLAFFLALLLTALVAAIRPLRRKGDPQ